jgi:hypothetical protein
MGHIRLGVLPATRKWRQVVALIESGASAPAIAEAASNAAQTALKSAADDPVFAEALWLLVRLPLEARDPRSAEGLSEIDSVEGRFPSLLELTAGLAHALDTHARQSGGKTDLGEIAQLSLLETLNSAIEPQLPSLFAAEPSDVRAALGRLSRSDRFAALARSFFARLTHRTLDYYLSRELANHVGAGRRFVTDAERRRFDESLALHCYEASKIVEAFAGGWYGKHVWRDGALTRKATTAFAAYAFKKLRDELGRRRDVA